MVVPEALLQGPARLMDPDSVQLTELDWLDESLVRQQFRWHGGESNAPTTVAKDDGTATSFHASRNFRACIDPQLRPKTWRPTRFSDFYTDLELRNTEGWVEYYQHIQVRTCLAFAPARPDMPGAWRSCARRPQTSPTATSYCSP